RWTAGSPTTGSAQSRYRWRSDCTSRGSRTHPLAGLAHDPGLFWLANHGERLADCGGGLESVALPSRTGLPADVPAPVGVKCMAVCSGNERHLDSGAHVDATG